VKIPLTFSVQPYLLFDKICHVLNNIGYGYTPLGKFNERLAYYEKALYIYRNIDHMVLIVPSLSSKDTIYGKQ